MRHKSLNRVAQAQDFAQAFLNEYRSDMVTAGVRTGRVTYDDRPYWTKSDGGLVPIKDMSSAHIRACIRRIARLNYTWRAWMLPVFAVELKLRAMG